MSAPIIKIADVDGMEELQRGLSAIPDNLQAQAMRTGVVPLVTYVRRVLQNSTPVDTGALRRAWGQQTRRYTNAKTVVAWIGIRGDFSGQFTAKPKPKKAFRDRWGNLRIHQRRKVAKVLEKKPILYAAKVENYTHFAEDAFSELTNYCQKMLRDIYMKSMRESIQKYLNYKPKSQR